jgi:hypothetical protein
MRRSLNLIDSHKKNESSFCHDRLGTSARKTEEDTPLFFEFSLCLSRVCLGKMIVYMYKWLKKGFFPHSCACGLAVDRVRCWRVHADRLSLRRAADEAPQRATKPSRRAPRTVPAPGNLCTNASEIRTGWSPRSERPFQR